MSPPLSEALQQQKHQNFCLSQKQGPRAGKVNKGKWNSKWQSGELWGVASSKMSWDPRFILASFNIFIIDLKEGTNDTLIVTRVLLSWEL